MLPPGPWKFVVLAIKLWYLIFSVLVVLNMQKIIKLLEKK